MTSSKTTHPVLYRIYQFFVALKAGLPPWVGGKRGDLTAADEALVTSILTTASQQHLFYRMPPNDRRHALAVVRTLQPSGYRQPALMQAALLHDVGKSLGQPILHRVLIVLLEAFWPGALSWLSGVGGDPAVIEKIPWWRRPFVIHAQHAKIGATWAEAAACEPMAVCLIARHEDIFAAESTEEEKLLAALQWADDLN
ncbi:MAG: hypothetical protein JXM69_06140 [Anaerolineae bacterium]|nr:hypothetical protein [Anaerolineae bacterium]